MSVLVLACGALISELQAIVAANGFDHVTIECLPGDLHNHPDKIPAAVDERLAAATATASYDEILVGYADCGTGGHLDAVCERWNATRLPGPHCYEVYAGVDAFALLSAEEPGTLYLTDFLAKHFDLFIWKPLGLDRHPELFDAYFGNYRRVVHLAQTDDPTIRAKAEAAASQLGLEFEYRPTGYGRLEPVVVELGRRRAPIR